MPLGHRHCLARLDSTLLSCCGSGPGSTVGSLIPLEYYTTKGLFLAALHRGSAVRLFDDQQKLELQTQHRREEPQRTGAEDRHAVAGPHLRQRGGLEGAARGLEAGHRAPPHVVAREITDGMRETRGDIGDRCEDPVTLEAEQARFDTLT